MQRQRTWVFGVAVLCVCASVANATEWDPSCGLFVHWNNGWRTMPWERGACDEQQPFALDTCGGMTFMPHPGGPHFSGGGAAVDHPSTQCTFERVRAQGGALAVMIRRKSAPIPYVGEELFDGAPDSVPQVLGAAADLDYLLMDLEGNWDMVVENIRLVGRMVRQSDASPRMGNYSWYPGPVLTTAGHVNGSDRRGKSRAYLRSDLTVAMPSCYAYDDAGPRHTRPNVYNGPCPNEESAMFWAPLERFSNAARNLPSGHELIPFVSPYICRPPCDGPPPTRATLRAMISHFRMRGANGFVLFPASWEGVTPVLSDARYERLVLNTWHALDSYYAGDKAPTILNLETEKTTGVNWSGIATQTHVVILTSNLGPIRRVPILMPELAGVPSEIVAERGHQWHVFERELAPGDVNGDGTVSYADLQRVILSFGKSCTCDADQDNSGTVDVIDLLIVLEHWTG